MYKRQQEANLRLLLPLPLDVDALLFFFSLPLSFLFSLFEASESDSLLALLFSWRLRALITNISFLLQTALTSETNMKNYNMKVIHLTQNIQTNLHLLLRFFFGRHGNRNCKAWIWAPIMCGSVAQTTITNQITIFISLFRGSEGGNIPGAHSSVHGSECCHFSVNS